MDLAKLVAVLCTSDVAFADIVGPEKVAGRSMPLMQIPTTSGTGSEAGTRALVTDPVSQNKQAVQSRFMLADIAIVDPDLTMTVPKEVTAATGVDALAHCVEAYTSRKAHPMIDLYALEGARLVGQYKASKRFEKAAKPLAGGVDDAVVGLRVVEAIAEGSVGVGVGPVGRRPGIRPAANAVYRLFGNAQFARRDIEAGPARAGSGRRGRVTMGEYTGFQLRGRSTCQEQLLGGVPWSGGESMAASA